MSHRVWRIMVAEDEPGIRTVMAEVLEEAGHDVLQACDGDEAVALLETGLDLLVTDIDMPGRNGFAVAWEARARRAGLPVLFVSGRYDDLAGRAGIAGYRFLRKPFSLQALLDEVRALLPDRSTGKPAEATNP